MTMMMRRETEVPSPDLDASTVIVILDAALRKVPKEAVTGRFD